MWTDGASRGDVFLRMGLLWAACVLLLVILVAVLVTCCLRVINHAKSQKHRRS